MEAAAVMLVELRFGVETRTAGAAGNADGVLRQPEVFVHMGEINIDAATEWHFQSNCGRKGGEWKVEEEVEVQVDGDVLSEKEKRGCALAWRCS